jgi:hypothetical protein
MFCVGALPLLVYNVTRAHRTRLNTLIAAEFDHKLKSCDWSQTGSAWLGT